MGIKGRIHKPDGLLIPKKILMSNTPKKTPHNPVYPKFIAFGKPF
jgi:hypothetical protein